jgi:hypothetical protein
MVDVIRVIRTSRADKVNNGPISMVSETDRFNEVDRVSRDDRANWGQPTNQLAESKNQPQGVSIYSKLCTLCKL